ncbi:hypothetical protein OEZ86_013475 [Tetradesmus obliquus]|nr:hypothetical protein OEZ86_013475 [Tetradesmus obliquus]
MDSGIDASHWDLEYAGGKSFLADDPDAGKDDLGHGTHVAGTIGAKNNGRGIVGIAPAAPIFSLKVLSSNQLGYMSTVIVAVQWLLTDGVKLGIRVVNISLAAYVAPGSKDYDSYVTVVCGLMKQLSDAGVVVTAAAGNNNSSLRGNFPASCPTVLAVTFLDTAAAAPSPGSNFLPTDATAEEVASTISAPGSSILSTFPLDQDDTGIYTLTGSSMASPAVARVALNCLLSGACPAGNTGAQHMATVMAAAQQRLTLSPAYSYADSASRGKLLGPMVWSKF